MTREHLERIEELENSIAKRLDDIRWEAWEAEEKGNKQLSAIVDILEEMYNLICITEG